MHLTPLRLSALCLAVSLASPAWAHEGDHDHEHHHDGRAATEAIRTGSGAHVYQSVPNWAEPPEGEHLGPTHGGIVVDSEGLVYFSTDHPERPILVYSPEGEFIRSFGDGYEGIHSMILNEEDGQEFIYAVHLHGKQLVKFELDGTVAWTLGYPEESGKYDSPDQFNPTAVAVGPEGDIYLADGYGEDWIHHYDADRNYIGSFGGPGDEPGQFQTAHGLALDPRTDEPRLLVADRENRRLQYFDLEGNFLEIATENLRRPCAFAFHGDLLAVAELEGRVTLLDANNTPVAFLGDNPDQDEWANYHVPPEQWETGIFTAPHGVRFDDDGNLFVMDWNAAGRVTYLEPVER